MTLYNSSAQLQSRLIEKLKIWVEFNGTSKTSLEQQLLNFQMFPRLLSRLEQHHGTNIITSNAVQLCKRCFNFG